MRKTTRTFVTAVATLALLTTANTASAGEPFHPIVQPAVDFFNFFFGWF